MHGAELTTDEHSYRGAKKKVPKEPFLCLCAHPIHVLSNPSEALRPSYFQSRVAYVVKSADRTSV